MILPVRILFSISALLGAALLFLVEPMFARMVLPLLGGAPAVWNTCMVFYQLALLGGYLYAHLVGTWLKPRHQVLLHAAFLVAAAAVLPLQVRGGEMPPASNPIGWVLWQLLVSLGMPFVVLAATGPLLQRWFAALPRERAGDPYSLFAASNVGSFVALLGYPLLIEPAMRLHTQSAAWAVGYGGFALLMTVCGAWLWRLAPVGSAEPRPMEPAIAAAGPAPSRAARPAAERPGRHKAVVDHASEPVTEGGDPLRWVGLAAVPSTLMMSVTTFISMDVAAVPLLWVVPLALYLLTFVLAFAERQIVPRRLLSVLLPVAVVLIVALVLAPPVYPALAIVLHLASFLIVALVCHMELAASRPPAEGLTAFYLWLSAGGAVGGLFNALVAPFLFVNPFEYPLAAISSVLLMPGAITTAAAQAHLGTRRAAHAALAVLPLLLVIGLVLGVQRFSRQLTPDLFVRYAIIFALPCLICYVLRRTPLRMGVALALVAVGGSFIRFDNRVPLHVERSFFGVHRVLHTGREHVMLSGTTNHGVQSVDPSLRCEPLSYYSRLGPVGQILGDAETTRPRVGVVGLGTASLAAYHRPGQSWTFYEINPAVERIARNPEFFTFLRDCAPDARVVTGDARLMLEQEPDASFDVLMLDAFSSDAIPVHLMTLEAMELYFKKLAPGGILGLHISNRFLNLAPVVAATSRAAGLTSRVQFYVPTQAEIDVSREMAIARWAMVARSRRDFGDLLDDTRWESLDEVQGPVWTDDYSNVFSVFQR